MECAARGMGSECDYSAARRCGLCGAVSYCSRDHQIMHWNIHKEDCRRLAEQMGRIDSLIDFPFTFTLNSTQEREQHSICTFLSSKGLHDVGLWKLLCSCSSHVASTSDSRIINNWDLPGADCPCADPEISCITTLRSWKEYYCWRGLPIHSPVALLLHWPLTLYHCLQISSLWYSHLIGNHRVNIHYLGPETELLQLAVFGELLAILPGVEINIEFVGPAVPQFRDGENIKITNYPFCSDKSCRCKNLMNCGNISSLRGVVMLKLHKGFYHERYHDLVSSPDLIFAPNAGIAAYASWLPTLELLKDIKVPSVFTDFCEEAAYLASNCIRSITGLPIKLPIQVNPFRQPLAVNNSGLLIPCYSNCFAFGI